MSRKWIVPLCWLMIGCTLPRPAPTLPGDSSITREQLVIFSDFGLPKHHRLVEELAAQRGDLAELLDLPSSDEPIYVYLFESKEPYETYVDQNYPGFPHRRAFFVETDTRLTVYAHWGDRVAEDLRHEVAHGYLHAVVPNIPLWLDEGLAEYFEVPRGYQGVNRPHVTRLLDDYDRGQWRPDLQRLQYLTSVSDMTQRDYAESWAWVHWMLTENPEQTAVLQNYMARLRVTGESPPLSGYIREKTSNMDRSMIDHLMSLAPESREDSREASRPDVEPTSDDADEPGPNRAGGSRWEQEETKETETARDP